MIMQRGIVIQKYNLAEDEMKERKILRDGENVDCKSVKMKQSKCLKLDICLLFEREKFEQYFSSRKKNQQI